MLLFFFFGSYDHHRIGRVSFCLGARYAQLVHKCTKLASFAQSKSMTVVLIGWSIFALFAKYRKQNAAQGEIVPLEWMHIVPPGFVLLLFILGGYMRFHLGLTYCTRGFWRAEHMAASLNRNEEIYSLVRRLTKFHHGVIVLFFAVVHIVAVMRIERFSSLNVSKRHF